jgi:hypothetical protein
MDKTCKVCQETKNAVDDFFTGVNVCKKCKNIQQRLRLKKLPLPEKFKVKKVEFDCVCTACEKEKPKDYFGKNTNVCKECHAERQKYYNKRLPLPDRLKSKNVHRNTYDKVQKDSEPIKTCTFVKTYQNDGLNLLLEYGRSGNLLRTISL